MVEYISREAAIEAMYKDAEAHPDHTFWATQYEALRNIPAADVRPVKRGRWMAGIHGSVSIVCSACGYEWFAASTMSQNFCPNCGADMREG